MHLLGHYPDGNWSNQVAKSWMTRGLRTSIRKINKIYHDRLWDEYKLYRTKLWLLTRLSKRNYCNSFFEKKNANDMKATWEGINNKPDGILSTDPTEISNVL